MRDLCWTCKHRVITHYTENGLVKKVTIECGIGHELKAFTPRTECEDYEVMNK